MLLDHYPVATQRGNWYILTICDHATHYPEAIALPSIENPRVDKELVNLFSHVEIPDEILTDQGTNFMSNLLEGIYCIVQNFDGGKVWRNLTNGAES